MGEVIFDCGSYSIKGGFSHQEEPFELRTVIGHTLNEDNLPVLLSGEEALSKCASSKGKVRLSTPVEEGFIDNFDRLELLLETVYDQNLKTDASTHSVILAEPHYNPPKTRDKSVELFFERFRVPSLNISQQGVLCLVGTGRITGVVVDCGHSASTTVPLFESYGIPHSVNRTRLGGSHVNTALAKLLSLNGIATLAKTKDLEIVRKLKEQHCQLRISSQDPGPSINAPFSLPDGETVVSLSSELWRAPEGLFSPAVFGLEWPGVAESLAASVKSAPMDLTRPLLGSIVLCGGSSKLKHFEKRITNDLKDLVAHQVAREVRVTVAQHPAAAAWHGGKVFAGLRSGFTDRWMSRAEYFEFGPERMRRKLGDSPQKFSDD